MSMPPPGWYPDPASDDSIRYWDGQLWTDRVQPKSVPPPPAPPASPLAPPAAPAPQLIDPYSRAPGPYGAPGQTNPYYGYGMAPAATQAMGRVGPDGQPLAGWWRRVGGYLIDTLITVIPAAITAFIVAAVVTANGGALIDEQQFQKVSDAFVAGQETTIAPDDLIAILAPGFWTVVAIAGVVWLIISLINGVYLISRSGQTVGDRLVNVRKVMAGRTVPSFAVALARWLIPNVLFALIANFVPFGFLLTYVDYLWPLWDRRSQTLHDKMVRTYVERSDLAGPPVRRG